MDLEERLETLKGMSVVLSAQAKNQEAEAQLIDKIGLALQAFSSIDFNDTFQVVLNSRGQRAAGGADLLDSEYSGDGTGSTEYEVIQQAASNAHSSLQLIKSESSGAASSASNNVN